MDFLSDFEPLLKSFWYIAIPTTLVFAIQSVLTFFGLDATDGIDADFDSDFSGTDAPFQLFSFRNLVNFLIGFSWGGISLYNYIDSQVVLITAACVIGAVFVGFFFLIIKQLLKLSENNTFDISSTLFKTGDVYLRIPENKTGTGIVQISINGTVREMKAITETAAISTGTLIKVVGIRDDLLLVEKI
jgi:hypothetical protein